MDVNLDAPLLPEDGVNAVVIDEPEAAADVEAPEVMANERAGCHALNTVFSALYSVGGLAFGATSGIYYYKINQSYPIPAVLSGLVNIELFFWFSVRGLGELQERFVKFWQDLFKTRIYYAPFLLLLAAIKLAVIGAASFLASIPYYAALYLVLTNNGKNTGDYSLFWESINIAFLVANSCLYVSATYDFIDEAYYGIRGLKRDWNASREMSIVPRENSRMAPHKKWTYLLSIAIALITAVAEYYGTTSSILSAGTEGKLGLPLWLKDVLILLPVAFAANATTFIFSFKNAIDGNFTMLYKKTKAISDTAHGIHDQPQADNREKMIMPSWLLSMRENLASCTAAARDFMAPSEASADAVRYRKLAINLVEYGVLWGMAVGSIWTLLTIIQSSADATQSIDNWYTESLTPKVALVLGYLAAAGAAGINGSSISGSVMYSLICDFLALLVTLVFRAAACLSSCTNGQSGDFRDRVGSYHSDGQSMVGGMVPGPREDLSSPLLFAGAHLDGTGATMNDHSTANEP